MNLFKHCLSGSVAVVLMLSALPAIAADTATDNNVAADKMMHHHGPCKSHEGCKGMRGHEGMRRGGGDEFANLNLTDDQKTKLQASRESFMKDNQADFDKLKADRMKLMQLKKAAEDKDPNIKTQRDLMKKDFEAIQSKRDANLKAVLTPDQYKQYEQNRADRKKAWESRKKDWDQKKGEMKPEGTTPKAGDNS